MEILTKKTFTEKISELNSGDWVFKGNKPAILDFYADWCGPCKMIAPILEELSKEYNGKIDFYKIDVDKEPELSRSFKIQSIPSLLFISMEGNPQMALGALSKNELKKAIKNTFKLE